MSRRYAFYLSGSAMLNHPEPSRCSPWPGSTNATNASLGEASSEATGEFPWHAMLGVLFIFVVITYTVRQAAH